MIDAVKDYLAPKRFGVVAYVCLIVHFLCGLTFTAVTSAIRAGEIGKFSCTIDTKSTAVYKTYVEKTCYARYEQTYNSPLPLYSFVLLSIGFAVLVSVIYSLAVSARVEEIDQISNGSDEPRTDGEESSNGFYVFYFYFFHLVVRSLFAILFTVLQYTVFYPSGFDFEFSCSLTTDTGNNVSIGALSNTSIACENSTASEKQIWSMIVSVLNTIFALITLGEVIYLIWRRFPILSCRCEVGWSCDTEFIAIYLLRKRYVRVKHGLSIVEDNIALCVDFYKRQVLNRSCGPDICYGQKTDLDDMYVNVIIHTGRAQHRFLEEMERYEIFHVYMKVPESSIRLDEIKDLFYPNEDTKGKFPRTILAVGRPGIGKTVLTEKIIRDWANEIDGFYGGKITFSFKFRWFNIIDEYRNLSLKTFLRYGTGLSEEEFEGIFEEILKEPQKAIFIFDGLDEFNGDLTCCLDHLRGIPNDLNICTSAMTLFMKLVYGNLLQGATVLVTSRPTADNFYSMLNFDRSVEMIGFTSDKIEEYVDRFCENMGRKNLKPKIWNHVKSSSDLLNLCYIPVNCFIVCVSLAGCLNDPSNDTSALPTTLTKLYKTAIDHFAVYHNKNLDETRSEQTVKKLQNLAFDGMENGQLIFNKERFDAEMKKSGWVNSLSNPIFPVQTQFCFVHLTIQEFLAARHVIETLSPDEIEKFISAHIGSGKWYLVLQFIAGLLGEMVKMSGNDYHGCVLALTKSLTLQDGTISLDNYSNVLVMKCLREVDVENIVKKACDKMCPNSVVITYLRNGRLLSTSDFAAMTFVCKHLDNLIGLRLLFISEDILLSEFSKVLQQRCFKFLMLCILKRTGNELVNEQLTSALMKLKCTLNHKHNKLTCFQFSVGNMTGECLSNISVFIESGHASHLKMLSLKNNAITSNGISQLCQVLNDVLCTELAELDLRFNPIGDEGVRMLCNAIKDRKLNKLNKLRFDSCSLTMECVRYICEVLCDQHCELSELSLSRNNIHDEGVRMLCTDALIKEKCMLTKLAIGHCRLTDDCVHYLCETLQDGNCKLVELTISGNKFTEQGKSFLLDVEKTENCKLS